jgi:predicted O-methyltransferase YrrM
MKLLDRPPVFLVGAQRSGTTWLHRLLAAHPAIVSGQESHLFSAYLGAMWERWHTEERLRHEGGRTIGLGCYLTREQFIAQMKAFADMVLGQLDGVKPNATLLLEKTPDHALYLPLIRTLYPQAPIIHLTRDGRDVVASLLAAGRTDWGKPWTPTSARDAAQRWVMWIETTRRDLTPPFLEVRFEDLLDDGPKVLAQVFDFLGVPLPADEINAILRRYDFDASASRTAPESLVLNGECRERRSQEPSEFFRQGRVGAWRRELTVEEMRDVEEVAGETLRMLGYNSCSPFRADLATQTTDPSPHFVSTVPRDDRLWSWPSRLHSLEVPAQMLYRERLYLYATVFALAPARCLEIGVAEGWSSLLIANALRDLKHGRLFSIDPAPQLAFDPAELADVATLLIGRSPQILSEACERAGGLFDFVLLDGDHSTDGVRRDLEGLRDVAAPGCVVLAHDAYNPAVTAGLDQAILSGGWSDVGLVSTTCNSGVEGGREARYAGFRLLLRRDVRPPLVERLGAVVRRGVARLMSRR